jgi:hypothetical protein
MNFLLKRGALINYKTYQVFLSLRGSALPLSREGYEKMGYAYVPLRITPRGYVEVEGTIDGSTYSFLLDTGSFVSQLEPKIRSAITSRTTRQERSSRLRTPDSRKSG